MKNICIGLFAVALILGMGVSAEATFMFDDIDYWIGTGSNEAALVIDWNDDKNPQSLAWGYRWDGDATGEDMLTAIAGQGYYRERDGGIIGADVDGEDIRLYARLSEFGGGLGNSVFGLGYDLDNDGGSFVSGWEGNEIGYATDSDDHYAEGWFTGYWSYWLSSGDPYDGGSWGCSGTGMTNRNLSDGDWDGWSFMPGFSGGAPSEPVAAVPEPTTIALLGFGGLLLRRRRA